jgi:hypothetical protein
MSPRLAFARATPMTLCRVTLWSFILLLVTRTVADADLWGHLRFGLDMLASGSIHALDSYSFTADRPWVNHEWLAELLMAVAYRALGPLGLNLLKVLVIAVVAATLLAVARQERARPVARDLFIVLALFATYSRTQVVRPQIFSVALFCVLLYLLRESERGRSWTLWLVPLCFAAWANLHGAWIVGLAVLFIWMAGRAWQAANLPLIGTFAAIGTLSILATLLNPYGYGLWQFVAETVRPHRPDITDWRPLLQLPTGVLIIESLLPAVALIALWQERSRWRLPVRDLAIIAILTVATFRVGRVDAFLQAAIAFMLARPLIAWFTTTELDARATFRRASVPVGAFAVALMAYVGWMAAANLRVVHVHGPWIPDRTAALVLRDARPGARVLTWFDWGEYALWQLSPAGIRVSMDGRRETLYSERVTSDHWRFYEGRPDMVDYPDRIGADHVWLPSHFPIIEPLMRNGWTKVLDTGKSVVLARHGPPIDHPLTGLDGPNVFPWP